MAYDDPYTDPYTDPYYPDPYNYNYPYNYPDPYTDPPYTDPYPYTDPTPTLDLPIYDPSVTGDSWGGDPNWFQTPVIFSTQFQPQSTPGWSPETPDTVGPDLGALWQTPAPSGALSQALTEPMTPLGSPIRNDASGVQEANFGGMNTFIPTPGAASETPEKAEKTSETKDWAKILAGPLLGLAGTGLGIATRPGAPSPPSSGSGDGAGGEGEASTVKRAVAYRPGGTANVGAFAQQALGSFAGDARFKALYDQVLKETQDLPKPDNASIQQRANQLFDVDAIQLRREFERRRADITERANREGSNPTELLARLDEEETQKLALLQTQSWDKALATMQAQQAALLGRLSPALQLIQQINPMQALDALARIYGAPLPENDPTITNPGWVSDEA